MPDMLIYRVGPQLGGPSMCLMCQTTERDPGQGSPLSAWRALCQLWRKTEAFWSSATWGSKKDSDRAITPAAEAVCVPAHLVHQGPSIQAATPPSHLPLTGAGLPQAKKSCVSAHGFSSVVSNSLQPCGLWPARLLCQGGGSPGKNTRAHWPTLVAIPF